jgi:NAD(P)-dependent dehydrogenase (short-subunit alcohol dehydrogenase family)
MITDRYPRQSPCTSTPATTPAKRETRWLNEDAGRDRAQGDEAPIQAGQRWHMERTNAWHNAFHRLRHCYERRAIVIDERISILINNAGIGGPVSQLIDIDSDDWDEVFATNVRSVYLMCRSFLPPMITRGAGDIIDIVSVTGKRPLVGRTPYAASKTAVIGLTTTLPHEVGPLGIAVSSLCPWMERNFRLEAERTGTSVQAAEEAFVSRSALHRMAEESEVAEAVVAMLRMPGLCAADIDLSSGMVGRVLRLRGFGPALTRQRSTVGPCDVARSRR